MVTGGLVWFILMFCTYIMARDRHRDEFGWILFGLISSPAVSVAGLLILGDNPDYRKDY